MSEPHDGRALLSASDRMLGRLEDGLNFTAALAIFIVMLATTVQIFCRLAGYPVPGFLEASEQAIAIFAFLGVAYAQRFGTHIRMDMLIGALRGRARWGLEALGTLAAMGFVAVLIRYSWTFFSDGWVIGDVTYDYGIPTWPSKLLVPLAFSVWLLRLTLQFAGFVRLVIWPAADPVAVPVIQTPVTQARNEVAGTDSGGAR